jgi:hypothetical protein
MSEKSSSADDLRVKNRILNLLINVSFLLEQRVDTDTNSDSKKI